MNKKRHFWLACTAATLGAGLPVMAADGDVVKHMHEHYEAVLEIQSAVIAGSLEGVREPARWLAEHEAPADVPASWEEHVAAMRAAANAALNAEDLSSAATATSQLGLACGGCHVANEVMVEFEDAGRPSDKESVRPHMQRHQWAADRMWEGLIGPADVAWSRGANELFESPIRPGSVKHDGHDDEWRGMARRIHQLAANATTVYEPGKKAAIYAEFLGNCAACHEKLNQGPGR